MEELSVEERAVSLIIKSNVTEKTFSDERNEKLLNFLYATFEKEQPIPYDFIAKFVYSLDNVDSQEEDERLNANVNLLTKYYEGGNEGILKSNFDKIRNNYRLAIAQREFIEQTAKIGENNLAKMAELINEINTRADYVSKKVNSIEDTKSSIYTDFIAILGVFSSFVFVMFGGFSSLSDIISTLSLKEVSVARTLMISSFLMASMFTIVYSLIVWIAKIIGKSIIVKSCECNICRDPWHAFLRHKLYSIIMTTLVAVFIISLGVTIFVNIIYEFQTVNVSRFILLSNLTLMVAWTLLYPFLLWIAKFTGKSFKKCYSPKCQGDCLHKYKHLFYRRPVYFCVISILIFFICIPYIYQFIDKYVVGWIPK